MKSSYGVVIVSVAAALATALLLAPVPARGQLSEKDKAFKAKQIAKQFENNATVMTLRDRTGKQVGAAFGDRALYGETVLSPDLTHVAMVKNDLENETADLYVLDIASGKSIRLTTSKKTEFVQSPIWSPDGKQLAYVQIRDGVEGVYRRPADASVQAEVPVDFPRGDVFDVVEPLFTLGGHEMFEQVVAKRFSYQVVLLEFVQRLVQIPRQLVDPQVTPFAVAHLVDVLVDRRPRIDLLLDPVEA